MKRIIGAAAVMLSCVLSCGLPLSAQDAGADHSARLLLAKHAIKRHRAHKHGKHKAPKHPKRA